MWPTVTDRLSSVVCRSVCHSIEPCKNGDRDAVWVVDSGGPKKSCIRWVTLAQPGEYHWTVHVRRRCGLMSNYFDQLLLLAILLVYNDSDYHGNVRQRIKLPLVVPDDGVASRTPALHATTHHQHNCLNRPPSFIYRTPQHRLRRRKSSSRHSWTGTMYGIWCSTTINSGTTMSPSVVKITSTQNQLQLQRSEIYLRPKANI